MWQFISSRGKEYGLRQNYWLDERSDPEKSTRAAARHLKDLYMEFGDWYLAMAAYNAGPARVQGAMRRTGADNFWRLADRRALPRETINYVPTILAMTIIGKNPEKYGFNVTPEPPLETERVAVDKATDLRVIAEAVDVPIENLRQLNTHVLRWTTPPDDPEFQLVLPKGHADRFMQEVASLPESKRLLFTEHVIRKGDTLAAIARRYGTTIDEVAQTNRLSRRQVLRIGQTLNIPLSGSAATRAAVTAASNAPTTIQGPTSYTVRRGDTLGKIAARFAVTVDAILSWNKRTDLTVIHPGDRLTIYAGEN
jgi:membrane-bound lytic murein transglycosylase D